MASTLLSGLSGIVATISPPASGTDNTVVEATNVKALGSYNWIEDEFPTIAIPGRPAVWRDLPIPIRLRGDLGAPFFDENIARKCGYPLEPDLLAIEVCQEADTDFNLSNEKIDIVTNRNNLRKLILFANPREINGGRYSDSFRIDAQLAPNGRTMVLTRFEKPEHEPQAPSRQQSNVQQPRNRNHPRQNNGWQQNNNPQRGNDRPRNSNFIGYDHVFERMCTEDLPIIQATDPNGGNISLRPMGYNRIVRYDLLGLRFLVRSRVDGMIPEPAQPRLEPTSASEIDDLAEALGRARLESEAVNTATPILQGEASGVRHVKFGEHVPQELLMDVKLAPNGNVDWNNAYPQYFLSQTPNLRVAARTTGPGPKSVTEVRMYDQNTLEAGHDHQCQRLRNLVAVLRQMRQILQTQTQGNNSQPLAFVWTRQGGMVVHNIEEVGEYLSDRGLDKF